MVPNPPTTTNRAKIIVFNPKSINYDDKIHQAIRKYGYHNFKIEIIEVIDNVLDYELVNERE